MFNAERETREVNELEDMENSDNENTSLVQAINGNGNGSIAPAAYDNEKASIAQAVILSVYNTCETLDDDSRDQLIKKISERFLNAEIILKAYEIKDIALMICSSFPEEHMESYYIDGTKDFAPGGTLYNFYFNKLKAMRKKGLLPQSKRAINKITKIKQAIEAEETYTLNEREVNSIKFLLQRGTKFSEVAYHWSLTRDYRQNVIRSSSMDFQAIFDDEWRVLKCSIGHVLICEDFKALHGFESGSKLRLNWNFTFTAQKLVFLRKKVNDFATVRLLNELPTTNENLHVATIYSINSILVPPLTKGWKKPTIKDAQDSVLLCAQGDAEMQEKITSRFGSERKPHPIIFKIERKGDPIRFVVLFHTLKYQFNRFSEAMDVCFKMYIVFHIPFPVESYQFFVLLNERFYQLNINLRKSAKVVALLKDLHLHESIINVST